MTEFRPNLVLCAIDASAVREATISHAAALAAELHAELVLFHVVPEWPFGPSNPEPTAQHAEWASFAGSVRGEPVAIELRAGDPAREILDYARRSGCRLIVLGSHARVAMQYSLGSVAGKVLAHAPCPVVVVPASAAKALAHGPGRAA